MKPAYKWLPAVDRSVCGLRSPLWHSTQAHGAFHAVQYHKPTWNQQRDSEVRIGTVNRALWNKAGPFKQLWVSYMTSTGWLVCELAAWELLQLASLQHSGCGAEQSIHASARGVQSQSALSGHVGEGLSCWHTEKW